MDRPAAAGAAVPDTSVRAGGGTDAASAGAGAGAGAHGRAGAARYAITTIGPGRVHPAPAGAPAVDSSRMPG
ncbi:hypothetical protein GCM10023079_01060 [Streptomyces chitinivorans]